MNKENLLKMAEYIKTVDPAKFDMLGLRTGGFAYHECQTVGCILGHCTILDDYDNLTKWPDGDIKFVEWSEKFTGLDGSSNEWKYLFSGHWAIVDDTPLTASKRIKDFVENGLPPNLEEIFEKINLKVH